jgi:transcriptional regulator with XRE-family HTH domain
VARNYEIAQIFGKYIRSKRNQKKLNREELAYRAGINETTIERIERGKQIPRLDTVHSILEVLEIKDNIHTIIRNKLESFKRDDEK